MTPDKVLSRDGRKTILPDHELERIRVILRERGDLQDAHRKVQYAVPVHLTLGITADADSSATIDQDVSLVNMLVEGLVENKEGGGTTVDDFLKVL